MTLKYREDLVKEVREGRLAIKNNNTLEAIELIQYCFKGMKSYYQSVNTNKVWSNIIGLHGCILPSKSVKEFYMKETKYTKADWISGKVALEWENDKAEKINKFFKECNNCNGSGNSYYKYYYCNLDNSKGYFTASDETTLPIVKIDDIMEEEFVLPEKWCIKPKDTTEANKIFEYEGIAKHSDSRSIYYYQHCPPFKGGCTADTVINTGYKEITYEQFLKYVVKIEEKQEFPKDDFGVIVENNNGKEIVDYLVSKGFKNPHNFRGLSSNGEHYCIEKVNKNFITVYCNNPTSKTYTLEQLKQLDSNNMKKKITHYNLIKEDYKQAVMTILHSRLWSDYPKLSSEFAINKMKEAGVLDIWFTAVYEPEKPKEKVITLSNDKSVKVTKEGLFAEGKLVNIMYIKSLYCETNTFGDTGWELQINNFDIGCYKNLNREDLRYILEAYKSLN